MTYKFCHTLIIGYIPMWDGIPKPGHKSLHTLGYDHKRHEYHLMLNGKAYRESVPPEKRVTYVKPTYWWKL